MERKSKILIVVDPTTKAQPALERVAHLPQPLNAEVMLLICDYGPSLTTGRELAPASVAGATEALLLRHRKRLEDLAQPLRAQGLDVVTDVRWDYPLHEAIIRGAVEWHADLVVKDTHYHPILRRSIFSNTDWNLIRYCPIELLLVKPRALGHVPCIVAAVDPLHPRDQSASLDDRILTSAKNLAGLMAGQTHVLHAFDVTPMILASTGAMMTPIALPINDITADMESTHTQAVRARAEAHQIPVDRVTVLQGEPRDVLVTFTDRLRADVVVMGSVSRSALERLFVGSTAEAVLDKLSCDVLIVRPADFKNSIPSEGV
ncbi:MAG: universal stress protein [Gammaproteobacteria bacterium]